MGDCTYQWALPPDLKLPPDTLRLRLDFFNQCIVLHSLDDGVLTTRMVNPQDLVRAMSSHFRVSTGILPEDALWWGLGLEGPVTGLYRKPQVWKVAFQSEPFQPAERLELPMPGLVFACTPGQPPWVWATKQRPREMDDTLYHAPLFNVFRSGRTCPGTHRYGQDPGLMPEEFFTAFFSPTGDWEDRLASGRGLAEFWRGLSGKRKFPISDLMPCTTLGGAINTCLSRE